MLRLFPAGLVVLVACGNPAGFCGDGTHFDSAANQCLPDATCGPGTHSVAGSCAADYPEVTCGVRTSDVGGVCVADPAAATCGAGTVLRGQTCVSLATQQVSLPLPSGVVANVAQSFNGFFTHHNAERYAVDFSLPQGSSIVAARGGRVWAVRQDSTIECSTQPCASPTFSNCENDPCAKAYNFITIDHGDGTFARYLHLQANGAVVRVGDVVCKGQPIGLSGNTGYSTAPHLHFEVDDPLAQSLPIAFDEIPGAIAGEPFVGSGFVSANAAPPSCAEQHAYSTCPTDLFAFLGLQLDPGIPCAVVPNGTAFVVSGTSFSAWPEVTVGRKARPTTANPTPAWSYQCAELAGSTHFSVPVDLSDSPAFFNFIAAVATNSCQKFSGFYNSPTLRLGGP